MKDSEISWVGEIPNDWVVVKNKYCFLKKKEIAGIRSDRFDRLALTLAGVVRRSKDDAEGLQPENFISYQVLRKQELVFKLIDLKNISTSRVGLSSFDGIVSPAYVVLRAKDNILPEFAYYFFYSMWQREIFNALGDSGVRSNLSAENLLSLSIPIPVMSDQVAIVDLLNKKCAEIDALTADIEKQIELLQEYKKSVITEAVTKGLDPNVEMKDSGVEWIGFTPRKWKLVRVKHVLYEVDKRSKTGEEEPLSMSQVYGIIPSSMISVANPASSFVGAKIVSENDLVLNKLKAHLGVFAVSNYHGLVSPDYAVYRSREPVTAQFLQYLFRTPCCITEFRKYINGVGAGLSRLYTSDLFRIKISLPDSGEQMAIVNYLNEKCSKINDLIDDKTKQITSLRSYKCSVIYEYITGKKTTLSQTQE